MYPQKINNIRQSEVVKAYEKNPKITGKELGIIFNVSNTTIFKILRMNNVVIRPSSESKRKYPVRQDFFDEVNSEEKAYIMGILYADGYNDTSRSSVNLGLKESDKEILDKITALIQPTKPLQFVKINKPNCENQYRLVICNKHISQKIAEYGCPKAKTFLLEFPVWLEPKLYNHFIRGYIDGDGWIGKRSVSIVGTEKFLDKISEICNNKFGFNTYKRKRHKHRNHNIFMLEISGRKKCVEFLNWIYKDATLFLNRKFAASKNLEKVCRESSSRNYALGDGSSDCSVTNDFSLSLKKESNGKFTYVLKR
jgi:hypothetical protein